MHEVGASAVRALVAAAGRAGIEAQPVLASAGISAESLEDENPRIGWDAFHGFVQALERRANGRFDAIVESAVVASPHFKTMIALFSEPIAFYRFVGTRWLPALVAPIRVAFEAPPSAKSATEDAFRVIVEIVAPHRSSAPVLRALGSLLRAMPRALGLAAGEVKPEIRDRQAAFFVRVPMPRGARARLKREAPSLDAAAARTLLEDMIDEVLRANHALARARAAAADFEERHLRLQTLATELGKMTELGAFGDALAEALQRPPFLCESVALSLVDHGAAYAVVNAGEMTPGAVVRTQPLRMGEREIARLETSGYLSTTRPDALDDLVPWLVIAIDRLLVSKAYQDQVLSSRPPEDGPSEEALHRRLARSADEWQLTPRQLACVERLVRGRSNREIAQDVGCTERTVEAHLAVVFRRAGVRARSSLVARFWSEAW